MYGTLPEREEGWLYRDSKPLSNGGLMLKAFKATLGVLGAVALVYVLVLGALTLGLATLFVR
jgi:hypothetical protein